MGLIVYILAWYVFVHFIWPYIWPLVLAWLLCLLVEPLVAVLEKYRIPRGIASLFSLLLCQALVVWLFLLLLTTLSIELANGLAEWPELVDRLTGQIVALFSDMQRWERTLPPIFRSLLLQQLDVVEQKTGIFLEHLLHFAHAGLFRTIPDVLWAWMFVFLASFFLSKDKKQIERASAKLFPQQWKPGARLMGDTFVGHFVRLLRIQVILLVSTWLLFYIYFALLLKVPYALLLSFALTLLDILPVVGPSIVFLPWIGWNFWWGDVWLAISLLCFYAALSVVRSVMQAYMFGHDLGIHPLVILLAMYVAVQWYGAAGFIIGPVAAVAWTALIRSDVWGRLAER